MIFGPVLYKKKIKNPCNPRTSVIYWVDGTTLEPVLYNRGRPSPDQINILCIHQPNSNHKGCY